jgi:hypothetical protein
VYQDHGWQRLDHVGRECEVAVREAGVDLPVSQVLGDYLALASRSRGS